MKFNNEYTIDRQSIKYMGEEISNNNTTFDELHCKIELNLDIIIEELSLQPNVDGTIKIDNIFHVKSSLIGKKGLNMENNDIVFIKDFSNYGNKIMTHAEKQASKSLTNHLRNGRDSKQNDSVILFFNLLQKRNNLNKMSCQHWNVFQKSVLNKLITKMVKMQFLKKNL